MEIKELKKKQIVTKDGHFMPMIFVDMSIPSAMIGAGATLAAKELNKQLKNTVMPEPQSLVANLPYVSISAGSTDMNALALSIDDVAF